MTPRVYFHDTRNVVWQNTRCVVWAKMPVISERRGGGRHVRKKPKDYDDQTMEEIMIIITASGILN